VKPNLFADRHAPERAYEATPASSSNLALTWQFFPTVALAPGRTERQAGSDLPGEVARPGIVYADRVRCNPVEPARAGRWDAGDA